MSSCSLKDGIGYRFEGTAFPSIAELLSHYQDGQVPITKRTQTVLKRAILKQTMENDEYTMNTNNIILDKQPLSKGSFFNVYRGSLKDSGKPVAVKMNHSEFISKMQESLMLTKKLKRYNHPNIVQLLGVCAEKKQVYIVMELMTGGDLLHFLHKHGMSQTPYQLTKFSLDAALAMEYLSSKNCIHRNLAARNCLVGHNREILKISISINSREYEDGICLPRNANEPIAMKWAAPEVC